MMTHTHGTRSNFPSAIWTITLLFVIAAALAPAGLAAVEQRVGGDSWVRGRYVVVDSDASADEVAEVIAMLDAVVADFQRRFSGLGRLDRPLVVRFHATRESYLEYAAAYGRNVHPKSNGYYRRATEPEEREVVFFLRPESTHLRTAIHEALHQYLHQAIPRIAYMPPWFDEGIAEYLERAFLNERGRLELPTSLNRGWRGELRRLADGQNRIPLTTLMLMDSRTFRGGEQRLHYAISYAFVHFLVEEHRRGRRSLSGLVGALAQGIAYEEALAATFGQMDMATVESEFYTWLEGQMTESSSE